MRSAIGLLACVLLVGCSTTAPARHAAPAHPSPDQGNSTLREADRPGDPWQIPASAPTSIEGYANRTSVAPGDPVTVFASTTAPTFVVKTYRMGWYGGVGARLVSTSARLPGVRQLPAVLVGSRHTAVARWRASTVLATSALLPGDYLLRLDASDGGASFVPLTVRGASARGAVVLVAPVTTWQAYNVWGCCSLYQGADGAAASRARAVSFDRPYAEQRGASEFVGRTLGLVSEAERLGLSLDYVTDVDLHDRPGLLDGARAVVLAGHDEYWSAPMRTAVTAARDAGVNLAFFGANAVFRRIRFEPSPAGPDRIEVNYKSAQEDPLTGRHDDQVTSNWPAPPRADPESRLTGAMYNCFARTRTAGVVVDPDNFLFQGSGATRGLALPTLIGPEIDRVQLRNPTPRPLEVLMHSPFPCPGAPRSSSDATYYTTGSGAGVFDSGTMAWVRALTAHGPTTVITARVVKAVTDNLLLTFSRGPAGKVHLARDNLRHLGIS